MSGKKTPRESRRSTRVPLRVMISVQRGAADLTCEGTTVVVNLHGARLSTEIGLSIGMNITIQVHLTGKSAAARVVYVDSANPLHCGIELAKPHNIWGVPMPPEDWDETSGLDATH